jgi:hypothetical protein
VRGLYIAVVVVVCPLLAYRLAVGAADRGLGWTGFLAALFGVPAAAALVAGCLFRLRGRGAAAGAIGAVATTFVLVFLTLEAR